MFVAVVAVSDTFAGCGADRCQTPRVDAAMFVAVVAVSDTFAGCGANWCRTPRAGAAMPRRQGCGV